VDISRSAAPGKSFPSKRGLSIKNVTLTGVHGTSDPFGSTVIGEIVYADANEGRMSADTMSARMQAETRDRVIPAYRQNQE